MALNDYEELTIGEVIDAYNNGYKVICDADYLVVNIEKERNLTNEK